MSEDQSLVKQQFMEGTTIFSAGDTASEAYLIEEGEVLIKRGEQDIAVLKQGDIFGEMALIRNKEHSSSAVAQQKSTLVVIPKDVLFQKIETADPLIAGLLHMFIKRLYASNEAASES